MSERVVAAVQSSSGIDRLADAASRRPLAVGRDPDALVREALVVGNARIRSAARRRATLTAVSALAAIVIAAFAGNAWFVGSRAAVGGSASELAIAGHRIETVAGTRIEATSATEQDVVLRLDEGGALFDVVPLGTRRTFEVRTPDATIVVRGTVFAVSVRGGRTRVDVFEGRVEVRDARGVRFLGAAESFSTADNLELSGLLSARGDRAAAVRAERSSDAAREPARSDPPVATAEPPVPPAAIEPAPAELEPTPAPRARRAEPETSAPPIDLAGLRAMLERGEFAEVLVAIDGVRPPRDERGDWAMIEGDAHRALGHTDRAAAAYERAVLWLTPTRGALAGYLAASQYERAGDAARALDVLDRAHAAERGSPLEERALAMHASLLARTGRMPEARTVARAYLAAFPGGEAVRRMEALLAE